MVEMVKGIFEREGIVGKAIGDAAPLNKQTAYFIGQGVGTFLARKHGVQQVIVGRDNRQSSYDLQKALIEGLKRSTMHVTDIGLVATPLVYWHATQAQGDAVGGVMVTGSYRAPEFNGVKLMLGAQQVHGQDLAIIATLIAEKKFAYGGGEVAVNQSAYSQYTRALREQVQIGRRLHVVVDAANGTAGLFVPRLMELWKQQFTGLFIRPDGRFPNHLPDPTSPSKLQALAQKVTEVRADIGIAYDGDGTRLAVVDERGKLVPPARILAWMATQALARQPEALWVLDERFSSRALATLQQVGGRPLSAEGLAAIKATMHQQHAVLAGSAEGHLMFAAAGGYEDAFIATGRILEALAQSDQPLSQVIA